MAEYPYTTDVAKIAPLFEKIRALAVPPKADIKWLKQAGFTSSGDFILLKVMRFIGFTDDAGVPTDLWKRYRGTEQGKALAEGIRGGYAALFSHFPEPQNRSNDKLRNFLKLDAPDVAGELLSTIINTFKTLALEADFSAIPRSPSPDPSVGKVRASAPAPPERTMPTGLSAFQEELVRESWECAEHGAFRAAHVMAWVAFMDCLEEMLASDGLQKVFAARPSWAQWATIEELRQNRPEYELINVAGDVGLLSKNDMKVLHGFLARRNECAHPSEHIPGRKGAEGYIEDLLGRVATIRKKSL